MCVLITREISVFFNAFSKACFFFFFYQTLYPKTKYVTKMLVSQKLQGAQSSGWYELTHAKLKIKDMQTYALENNPILIWKTYGECNFSDYFHEI